MTAHPALIRARSFQRRTVTVGWACHETFACQVIVRAQMKLPRVSAEPGNRHFEESACEPASSWSGHRLGTDHAFGAHQPIEVFRGNVTETDGFLAQRGSVGVRGFCDLSSALV